MCSCREAKADHGPETMSFAGRCSGGNAAGIDTGGSGMGGTPPLAMDLCGRQPVAKEVAIARCTRRLANVSLRE